MKRQFLATIGIISVLTFGLGSALIDRTAALSESEMMSPMQAATISGNFTGGEHPTMGMARIVMEEGQRYLEFDESFKTDKGPDLYVILHRSEKPPISGIQEQDYLSIAPLQKVNGAQRYEIPSDIDLKEFRSVAIWCRKFNATFGYAPFSGSDRMAGSDRMSQ